MPLPDSVFLIVAGESERSAGPVARKMLKRFLKQVNEAEAKRREEQSAD